MNTYEQRKDDLIFRTPNKCCPACAGKRLHTREETEAYHPYSGHGYTPEGGWTHPELAPAPKYLPTVVTP